MTYICNYKITCICVLHKFVKNNSAILLSQVVGVLNMQENGNLRAALSTTDVIEVRIGVFLFPVILLSLT